MKRALILFGLAATMLAGSAFASTFLLTKTSETDTTISFSWVPQDGADGYRFYAPGSDNGDSCGGTRVARSFDPTKTTTRFGKVSSGTYCVEAIKIVPFGSAVYPASPPPPPPTVATITQTISQGQALTGVVNWRAVYDATGDGLEEDPGSIRFLVDGTQVLTEINPPFGDTVGFWNSGTVANGQHEFKVEAVNDGGSVLVANAVTATVDNVAPPPPPPPPPSNATLFLSPAGSDAGSCTQPTPCRTFNRAYHMATPGAVVELAGGSYGGQSISYDAAKTSTTDVVFRPAPGANVQAGGLNIQGSHFTFDGSGGTLHTGPFFVEYNSGVPEPVDVTFQHVDLRGGQVTVNWGSDFTLTDVDIGGYCSQGDGFYMNSAYQGRPYSRNWIVQDSRVGDICQTSSGGGLDHNDCMAITGVDGFIFRRNRMWWCATQGFYTDNDWGNSRPRNITVENNMFGPLTKPGEQGAYNIIHIRYSDGVTVRYNSISSGWAASGSTNVQVYGNAGVMSACLSGVNYSYNVWQGITCSSTDVNADPGFVNTSGANFDLHVGSSSPVLGRGDQSSFPAIDIDGQARPISTVDAGADER